MSCKSSWPCARLLDTKDTFAFGLSAGDLLCTIFSFTVFSALSPDATLPGFAAGPFAVFALPLLERARAPVLAPLLNALLTSPSNTSRSHSPLLAIFDSGSLARHRFWTQQVA
jgi:hypothetical protein